MSSFVPGDWVKSGGMKRWWPWLLIPLVFSVWVILTRATGASLLDDTDTAVLLANIRERGNPWSWFGGDWPLFNHFYRPVSTLFFEFDNAVWGNNAAGYGLTNAVLAGGCIWLCFWVVRELTDHPLTAGLATFIFGMAHMKYVLLGSIFQWFWILALVSLAGLGRGKLRDRFWVVLVAVGGCVFLADLVPGPMDIRFRIVDWLPGRTASVMTVFALVSVAAYARFERLGARVKEAGPTAMDLPATKGTVVAQAGRGNWIWAAVSAVGLLLAFGSYEQAVILPGILTGVLVWFAVQGRLVRWMNLAWIWGLLIGYLALRSAVVPSEVSGYQAQQLRSGAGLYNDLLVYLLPGFDTFILFLGSLEMGLLGLLTALPWVLGLMILGNLTTMVGLWRSRRRWWGLGALLMGFVASLPMAWLKFFAHYHYFPAVFYSLLIAVMVPVVLGWFFEALSPSPVQAPLRE